MKEKENCFSRYLKEEKMRYSGQPILVKLCRAELS